MKIRLSTIAILIWLFCLTLITGFQGQNNKESIRDRKALWFMFSVQGRGQKQVLRFCPNCKMDTLQRDYWEDATDFLCEQCGEGI